MENIKKTKRIEIIGNEIAIFAPDADQLNADQTIYYTNNRVLSRYEPHDQSLRFPKTAQNAKTIRKILSANFDLSPEFLALVKKKERVEVIDGEIALYCSYADKLSIEAAKPKGLYNVSDESFRYPLCLADHLLAIVPPNFDLSPEFLALLNGQNVQSNSKTETDADSIKTTPKRPLVDLLLDEHPERCIVVSGFTDADEHFSCKVSHLDGVFDESDNSWRFSLATLPLLLVYFPAPDYQHSGTLKREFEPIECGF